jgi:hypothetical protein
VIPVAQMQLAAADAAKGDDATDVFYSQFPVLRGVLLQFVVAAGTVISLASTTVALPAALPAA